jgi:hypothetical protein
MTNPNTNATFSYSGPMKALFLVGLVFFGGGLLGSIAGLFWEPRILERLWWFWPFVIIGYYYFAKVCLTAWRERDNLIKVDGKGIAMHSKYAQLEFINWDEIVNIKVNRFTKRLIITDKLNKTMRLEFELDNFRELLTIIINNTPQLDAVSASLRKLSASLQR